MSVVGLCSSMKSSAFLVIVLLAIPLPLASFEIPPSFLFPVVLGASAPRGTAESRTADWIAKQVDQRDTGRDSRLMMQMRLFDRQGRARERTLSVTGLRGQGGAGDRVLVRFTYPNDIAGTGFLVWERPGGEDDRFLYLPALSRVRRISGAERQESFVGSDFTYEDIGGREFDEYTYAFAGADGENATWTAPGGGGSRPAWRLESKRRDASAQFQRVVSLVLKDSFVVVQADIYNRRNERQKEYVVRRLEQVQGVWTVMDSEMGNALEKTRTELVVERAEYNVGLEESHFTRRELERGARVPPGLD